MTYAQPKPRLFVVTYQVADDLLPERQAALLSEVEAAAKLGAVVLVFEVAAEIRSVDVKVPSFWLNVTGRLPIAAVAIVTSSMLVRVAANGFSLANAARNLQTKVAVFATTREAIAWANEH